ncbi:hypothetical protein BS333_05615 [Vibrio azureus]|uniref:Uncharacterized protein n=1 Tax=Vibrio azureus NBRC 104587 TaxID=1219077 RepID=U3ADW7_9VIBR|nr:hypothetical protein [Vibrio azureus]AUI85897.1 hypothetical protein BS333_05615 [Vibrio azureus]GAD78116.1 hypothetical protein VAZ01S_126_00020 [Vibrio azureus NBRC 104587]
MLKRSARCLILLSTVLLSSNSFAGWLNIAGKVKAISTYAHTNTIIVALEQQGTAIAGCSDTTSFAISKDLQPEARARMYSMALAAEASDSTITISYGGAANDCVKYDNNVSFRKIVRMIKN